MLAIPILHWRISKSSHTSLDSPTIPVLNENRAFTVYVIDLAFPSSPKDIHPDDSNKYLDLDPFLKNIFLLDRSLWLFMSLKSRIVHQRMTLFMS